MKKLLLFIVLMMLPFKALCRSVSIDGINYNLDSSNKTAEVAFGNYSGDIVIPSTVTKRDVEYTVTSIASNAFYSSPEMTSVSIPKSVTTIKHERGFFYNCNKLASIVVEEGNPNYDSREGCNAIIETASNKLIRGANGSFVPNSVTTIGEGAFWRCNISALSIPNSVTTIEYSAFWGSKLATISIPNSVTTIQSSAFAGCSELTSVYIGTGLENIGEYIFDECYKLKTIEINNNALVSKNYTGEEANVASLLGGQYVEEIVLGEEVTSVGDYAFFRGNMKSVKMSDNLIRIGNYAFWQCYGLTSIEFSNNLTYIGKWAFSSCMRLPSVTIPQSVKCVDLVAFWGCHELTKVVINSNDVVARDDEQFYTLTSCFGQQVKEFVLGEDVKKIAYIALSESEKLTSITISSNLTCVDDSAFHKCTSLADVYLYAEQVPETGKDVFVDSNYKNATLHVPANAVEAYRNAEQWKDFGSIVSLTDEDPKPTTDIMATTATQQPSIVERYTIDGKRINQPQRGLNIIKMSDGTTKKVIVR